MNRYLALFVFIHISIGVAAQPSSSIYNVILKDKGQSTFTINDPAGYLSPRAIERRERFGIAITEDDLPISPSYLQAIVNAGAKVLARSRWLNMVILEVPDPETASVIKNLNFVRQMVPADNLMTRHRIPGDEYDATENKPFFRTEQVDAPYQDFLRKYSDATLAFDYGLSLNQIQMINGTALHNQGFTGEGMMIAVLDAGFWMVDQMDPFDSLWINNKILGARDFVNPGGNVYDPAIHQHGMLVLSVMGGNLPGQLVGTAPDASYYLLRTEDGTAEYLMEEYYWVMGAEYADSVGADIINSSLGYTIFDDPLENHTYQDMDGNTTPVTIGADKAAEKGILVCNSAGNSGGSPWMYIGAPADGDSVFSIGAVDPQGNRATFSSLGPTYDGRIKPNIAAQGQETIIAAPWGGITGGSGTSFSSPVIAGMTACLWQANREYNNMALMNALQQSASQSDNPDDYLGYGIPDYQAAHSILGTSEADPGISCSQLIITPNPFTDHFEFTITLHSVQKAILEIHDTKGNRVEWKELTIGQGITQVKVDTRLKVPGLYFIRLVTPDRIFSGRAVRAQ